MTWKVLKKWWNSMTLNILTLLLQTEWRFGWISFNLYFTKHEVLPQGQSSKVGIVHLASNPTLEMLFIWKSMVSAYCIFYYEKHSTFNFSEIDPRCASDQKTQNWTILDWFSTDFSVSLLNNKIYHFIKKEHIYLMIKTF